MLSLTQILEQMRMQTILKGLKDIGLPFKKLKRISYIRRLKRIHSTAEYLDVNLNLSINTQNKIFFDQNDLESLGLLVSHLNPSKIIDEKKFAEGIMKRNFIFLGHEFDFNGGDISWNLDPITGKHWPDDFSYNIVFRGPGRLSDIKLPWELAKMQYLFLLGKVFNYTKDEKYATEIVNQIDSWITSNPPLRGIHWISALEVGMRVIAFVMVYPFIRRTMGSDFMLRYLASIYRQTEFIESNLSASKEANTHLIGESFALLLAGMFLNCPESRRWYEKGLSILLKQILLQVHEDGVHKEQSPAYHRFFLDYYYMFIILQRRNGLKYPKYVDDVVQKMTEFLLLSRMPNGDLPNFGDSDDARGIWVRAGCEKDYSALLGLGAVLFDRSDFRYAARDAIDEVLWLAGEDAFKKFQSMASSHPQKSFMAYPDSGYYIMRNGFAGDSDYFIFDCGPIGWGSGGHGHADALSFQLQSHGFPFFVDPGTYSYNIDYEWRDYFRSTRAHNTITVDGLDQSEMGDRMSWKTVANSKSLIANNANQFCFLGGKHDGYARLKDPVETHRYVFYDKRGFFIVCDYFFCNGEHQYDHYLYLDDHCFPSILAEMNGVVEIKRESERLYLHYLDVESREIKILRGQIKPSMLGWFSGSYGEKHSIPAICSGKRGYGNTSIVVLLSSKPGLKIAKIINKKDTLSFLVQDGDAMQTCFYYDAQSNDCFEYMGIKFQGNILYFNKKDDAEKEIHYLEAHKVVKFESEYFGYARSNKPFDRMLISHSTIEIQAAEQEINSLTFEIDKRYRLILNGKVYPNTKA